MGKRIIDKGDAAGIGLRIKRRREDLGIRQIDLSERSGFTVAYICNLENGGIVNPGIITVGKLADALDVDPGWLAWGSFDGEE